MVEVNIRRGPSGPISQNYFSTQPSQSSIYINPITGNDNSSGFASTPVKTMAEVGKRIGDEVPANVDLTVHIQEPYPDVEGFPIDELCKPRFVAGALRWRAEQSEIVSGELTLTSRSGGVYTFAGNNWVIDEWVGYSLEVVSSSTPNMQIGDKKHISHNTIDTITVAFPHNSYPNFGAPTIGDTFRIVYSKVNFNLSPYSNGVTPYLAGGTSVSLNVDETRPRNGIVQLRNIALRVPDGQSNFTWYMSGGLDFVGTEVTTDGITRPFAVAEVAGITAGQWILSTYNPGEYVYGWGLSMRPRVAGGEQCMLWMGKTLSDIYLVGGAIQISEGSWCRYQSGSLAANPNYAGLFVQTSGQFWVGPSNSNYQRVFRTFAQNQRDIYIGGQGLAVVTNIVHVGNGAIFWIDSGGKLLKSGTNTIEGSTPTIATGLESWVNRGGQAILSGTQTNLGDVSAGTTAFSSRANAPWAVGDRVPATVQAQMGEVIMRAS